MALSIDLVIAFVPLAFVAAGIAWLLDGFTRHSPFAVVYAALCIGYSMLDVVCAGTPGKCLLGLRIAAAQQTPAGVASLLVRWAVRRSGELAVVALVAEEWFGRRGLFALPTETLRVLMMATMLLFLVLGLGTLLCVAPGRRCLHDWIAGTAVYSETALRPASPLPVGRAFEVGVVRRG